MKSAKLLVLLTALLAVALPSHAQEKVKVEIFYETLNEVPLKFFVEQFRLVSETLSDNIDLRLFPYGNTEFADSVYTCPYGDQQCVANKLHACFVNAEITQQPPTGIDSPVNQTTVSRFANCFFKNRFSDIDIFVLGEKCQSSAGIEADWAELHSCVVEPDNKLTDQLRAISDDVATDLKKDGLVVRIGGTANPEAKTNLLGAICSALGTSAPEICANSATTPNKVKIGVYFEAQNSVAYNYIVSQLSNWYHVLEDMADIDFVPYGYTQLVGDAYNCTSEDKCILNKFIALVVNDYLTTPKHGDPVSGADRVINFLTCLAKSTSASVFSQVEGCVNEKLQDSGEYIDYLLAIKSNDPKVSKVMETNRLKTEGIAGTEGLPRVPTITVNGVVNYNAFNDLVSEICAQYVGPIKASICLKTNVTVIFEPLNHKSRTLFLEPLKDVFDSLLSIIDLKMLPVGRAVLTPGQGFVCPGGADQCNAMKLQACAIDFFWNDGNNYTDPIRKEVFDFIVCTFKNRKMQNVIDASESCSQLIENDPWFTIHGCYSEGTADGIVDEYIQEAQSIIQDLEHQAIPIVLVNGVQVTDLSTLKATVCGYFDEYHSPDYCFTGAAPKVNVQVYFDGSNALAKEFFTKQYNPWYIFLEEISDIHLYAAGNVRESILQDGTCDSYLANSTCLANKILAFVNDKYNENDDDGDHIDGHLRTKTFLACFFKHPSFRDNVYAAAEYCTEETLLADEWFDLLITAKSEVGNAIYKTVVDLTDKFMLDNDLTALEPIPWIAIDNRPHSIQAENDLLQTICSLYTGTKPLECTPVEIEIYYSAIHAQSREFFITQLVPVFRELRERIHLKLVPYGLANSSLTLDEECSLKNSTCLANTAQACVINKYFADDVGENTLQWDGKNQTFSFILCFLKQYRNQAELYTIIEECANQNIILADEVTECAHQSEGRGFLEESRQKTLTQFDTMEYAPWILINGIRSAGAQSDLKAAVCAVMLGEKPDYCYQPTPARVKVQFHYTALSASAQSYVVNELTPHLRPLEEILDLDVVPFGLTEIITQANGSLTLICPGGEEECHANLIHACVYNRYFHNDDDPVSDIEEEYSGKMQVLDFIACYFSNANYPSNIERAATQCVEQTFDDVISPILECARSTVGPQLLKDFMEKKVNPLLPHLTYVPWITVNGKHSYSVEHHIQRTICDTYTGIEKPTDCYLPIPEDQKPDIVVHYEVGDAYSKSFFANLSPEIISSVANLKFVPFGRSTGTAPEYKCVNDETCVVYKEHSCLFDVFADYQLETLKVLQCAFGDQMPDSDALNECVNQVLEEEIADPWRLIQTCVIDKGDILLAENAALVGGLTPVISHVPWVIINSEHNAEAEVNLVNQICSVYYGNDKPEICKPDLLEVKIYYETNNGDSSTFFLNQLSTYIEYLDEMGKFSFVPYGRTTNNGGSYVCPNGELQCHANLAHACVLNRFYNSSIFNPEMEASFVANRIRSAGFVLCTAFQEESGSTDPMEDAQVCLNRNFEGDYWSDIHYCINGPDGAQLNAEMARQTAALSPPLSAIPVVTINGQQSTDAQKNLFQKLCDTYGNVRAPLCATLPSLAVPVTIYFSGNVEGLDYLNEQLYPFFKETVPVERDGTSEAALHGLITPELVAWGNTKYDAANTENPFTCEGGANECYINRFLACAKHYHGNEVRGKERLTELALCFSQNKDQGLVDPADVFNICANKIWILDPFPQLDFCAKDNSDEFKNIFLTAKLRTENNYPILTSFPAVTVNNQYDEFSRDNLLAGVCYHYTGYNPPAICAEQVTPTTTLRPTDPTVTGPTVTGPTVTGPTVTGPTVTGPTVTGPTVAPTTPPTGSGTTPVISLFVFLLSFLLTCFLY